jgi:hypothetical protein
MAWVTPIAGFFSESKLARVGRDVFISYAEEDQAVAALACKRLEDVGVSCWMAPRDILPGKTWAASIIDAIESCRAMVLVLSANSAASRQVAREVERADALHLPLLTIRVDSTELTGDLEYFLSNTQWLDVSQGRLEAQLAPLPRYVRLLLSAQRGAATRPPVAARAQRTKREMHALVTSWFAVLTGGHNAVMSFALQESRTLMFALRFGFYMVLAGAIISLPVSEAARRRPLKAGNLRLMQDLLASKRDLRLSREIRRLGRFEGLIIDDLGYIQQSRDDMDVVFTLLAERYERGSVLMTSNLPFSKWEGIFKDFGRGGSHTRIPSGVRTPPWAQKAKSWAIWGLLGPAEIAPIFLAASPPLVSS